MSISSGTVSGVRFSTKPFICKKFTTGTWDFLGWFQAFKTLFVPHLTSHFLVIYFTFLLFLFSLFFPRWRYRYTAFIMIYQQWVDSVFQQRQGDGNQFVCILELLRKDLHYRDTLSIGPLKRIACNIGVYGNTKEFQHLFSSRLSDRTLCGSFGRTGVVKGWKTTDIKG
jgi:hypothetical protein